jgi:hypothetical protein
VRADINTTEEGLAGGAYKYYLTKLGRNVVLLALKLRRFTIIPELAQAAQA